MPKTSRKGYLVALAVVVVGLGVGGLALWRLYDRVQAMPRVAMPGEATVDLPAGNLIMFAEQAPGEVGELRVSATCVALDARGAAIALSTPTAHTSYAFGRHRGESMFALPVATAGEVTIRCQSEGRFVLAIGEGIGTGLLIGILAVLVGVVTSMVLVIRTWRRRRRERATVATAGRFA